LKKLVVLLFIAPLIVKAQLVFPDWQPGWMDIHHISTGRGNATYMVFPDGTTLLFDAGEISETHPRTQSARNSGQKPDVTKKAHEWIVEYINRNAPLHKKREIDYCIISHFHDDHFGEWDTTLKSSNYGDYKLTGITGIAEFINIKKFLDRGHLFPIDLSASEFQNLYQGDEYHLVQTLNNYFSFLKVQQSRGSIYDTIVVGADDQITLQRQPEKYPNWRIVNVCAGGKIATGFSNRESFSLFHSGQYVGENPLSIGLKISYGDFDYFTGGDMAGINALGLPDENSIEAHVAPVIGPVDIATLNHHGNRDAASPSFVRTLRPRVWIQQTWSSDHPGQDVLRRITSTNLYPGPRDIFATDLLKSNATVLGDTYVNKIYSSKSGHVVVRVYEHGKQYSVYVLNDAVNRNEVTKIVGPLTSR
jgi:beta-lactamase superfamily II metal-dependent hydrolase